MYQFILTMSDLDFDIFISQSNLIGRILIAHFLAIQIVIGPIIDREWQGRRRSTPIRTNLDWIYDISTILPAEQKHLITWPRAVADNLNKELAGIMNDCLPKFSVLRRGEGLTSGAL